MVKVSICCLAYNHAKYIRRCLDSFLMQKTDFGFEILIHDDASTDGTEEIIKEYAAKYPDIIKPIYEKENQYSKGVSMSKTFNFPRVSGEYVAMCEGDDYWTDPYKLQKQVDFLDANPEYTICFHRVERIFESKVRKNDILPTLEILNNISGLDYENLLKCNFIQTCSMMLRWGAVENPAKLFPNKIMTGDWFVALLFAKYGKIKLMDDVMSVYRVNSGGIWYPAYQKHKKFLCKTAIKKMRFYLAVYNRITDKDPAYFIHHVYDTYKTLNALLFESKEYVQYVKFNIQYLSIYLILFNIFLKTLFLKRKYYFLLWQ